MEVVRNHLPGLVEEMSTILVPNEYIWSGFCFFLVLAQNRPDFDRVGAIWALATVVLAFLLSVFLTFIAITTHRG